MKRALRRKQPRAVQFARPKAGEVLIRFEELHKRFGEKVVFEGLSLTVKEGETLSLIGASGAGKSVLLKCLVGLEYPDSGRILFEGEDVTQLDDVDFHAVRRRVAMVFQGSALFDSLTVGENVAYPLREHFPKMPEEEIREKVAQQLRRVGLEGTEPLRPSELSGGMRKRVGLARAIAVEPEVILWDEPTTGLDPMSTRTIDDLIRRMQRELGCTSLVVTHDMHSALYVSNRVALLAGHRIELVETPANLAHHPSSVAREFLDARA